ncbi:MAG: hypothetical protein ABSE87_02260 [Terracidiphilus sp.]
MNLFHLRGAVSKGSAAAIVAVFLSLSCVAGAATDKKSAPAPAKPAAPARPAAQGAKPAAGGAGAGHATGAGAGASHGPTANGGASHGPTANGGTSHGPTANGGTANGAKGPGANGGTKGPGTTAGNNRPTAGPGKTSGPGTQHTAIKSGPAPKGSSEHVTKSGSAVRTRANGKVSDVHDAKRGMDVHHGLNGGRRVSVERADHSRVVAERGRRGYVQRGYSFHGHDFARRSYFYHGRAYDRFYRGYGYRGVYLNVYAPGFYYAPAFYGWAYNPWAAPIAFGWGWGGSPWFGFYGGFFAPYPVYPSAAFWLTDYIISQDLQAAYAARQAAAEAAGDAAVAAGGAPLLTPDVKQQIADEVRAQLALENQEAGQNAQSQDVDPGSSGIARLVSDVQNGHPHVFVAGGNVDVVDANSGAECSITDGDAVQLAVAPPADATAVNVVVLASKGGQECPRASTVTVQLADLQEMQNHMRETIDQGLQDLKAKQGTGGLPQAPPSAQAATAPAQYAAVAPPPDPNVGAEIQQVDQQGDQSEKEVTAEASQDSGGAVAATPAAPATVALGQTQGEVEAILGQPVSKALLGPKIIYNCSGMKVIFKDGKVADVQ